MSLPSRIEALVRQVAADYQITPEELLDPAPGERGIPTSAKHRRFDLWWRIRQLVWSEGKAPSYPQIGLWFGMNHTTIIYGVRRWEELSPLLVAMEKAA